MIDAVEWVVGPLDGNGAFVGQSPFISGKLQRIMVRDLTAPSFTDAYVHLSDNGSMDNVFLWEGYGGPVDVMPRYQVADRTGGLLEVADAYRMMDVMVLHGFLRVEIENAAPGAMASIRVLVER